MNTEKVDQFLNLKSEIKIDLIHYFNEVKSEIDIIAQETLNTIDLNKEKNGTNDSEISSTKEKLLRINTNLVDLVEKIYNEDTIIIEKYFSNNIQNIDSVSTNKEKINASELIGYCLFVNKTNLKNELKQKVTLGVLVVTDWYLDQNQRNFIRWLIFLCKVKL